MNKRINQKQKELKDLRKKVIEFITKPPVRTNKMSGISQFIEKEKVEDLDKKET